MSAKNNSAANKLSVVATPNCLHSRIEDLGMPFLMGMQDSIARSFHVAVSDAQGQFIYVSPSFLSLSGFEAHEIVGKNHRFLNSGLHPKVFWQSMWDTLKRGETWRGEIRNFKKSGEYFWTETTIIPTPIDGYADEVFLELRQDITLKKQRELLLEAHSSLQSIFANIVDKHELFDHLLSRILEVTESEWVIGVEVKSGKPASYDLDSLQLKFSKGTTPWELQSEDYREFLKIFDPILQSRCPIYIHQGRESRRKTAELNPSVHKFSSFLGFPIQKDDRILGVIGLANRHGGYKESTYQNWLPICDIAAQTIENFEKKILEEKLEKEIQNQRILLEQSQEVAGIGGWAFDLELQSVYWTRQLFVLFGCDPTVFKPTLSSFSAFVEPKFADALTEKIQALVLRLEEFDTTVQVSSRFGEDRWVRILGRPQFENGQSQRIIGAVQEVSQLKKTESQIEYQRQKAVANARATALGQMAGGIAHEINNPLTIVLGTAKHFKLAVDRGDLEKEALHRGADKIMEATHRIAKVIKGLKAFAREGSSDPIVECSVKMIFEDTFAFCEARVKNHGINLVTPQLAQDFRLRCRPVEIAQAILNMILNSDTAVRGGESPWIRVTFEQEEKWSIFRVTDSGMGIPKSIAERMMEPFFTTKEVGKGMGLGLTVVKSVVTNHSGEFFLDSQNPNTSFVMKIPRNI
jgi:PAS domain S-box-containing protein